MCRNRSNRHEPTDFGVVYSCVFLWKNVVIVVTADVARLVEYWPVNSRGSTPKSAAPAGGAPWVTGPWVDVYDYVLKWFLLILYLSKYYWYPRQWKNEICVNWEFCWPWWLHKLEGIIKDVRSYCLTRPRTRLGNSSPGHGNKMNPRTYYHNYLIFVVLKFYHPYNNHIRLITNFWAPTLREVRHVGGGGRRRPPYFNLKFEKNR